jgi:glycine oxidase
MADPDVLVVGGGVIGLSVAREAAKRGLRVTVLSRDAPGSGASAVSAGMLELHYPYPTPPALEPVCALSRRLYTGLARDLRMETGVDIALDTAGTIALALSEDERAELRAQAAAIPGSKLLLDRAEWLAEEPSLGPEVRGALLLPDDHHVSPRQLGVALLLACEKLGVGIRRGVTARAFLSDGGRAEGVSTDAGTVRAGLVVLAAGAWSGQLAGLPVPVPVRPVKGQILFLEIPAMPRHVLHHQTVYIVPRPREGRLIVGATVEEAGYDLRPTAGGIERLIAAGSRLLPALRDARLVEAAAGLRPGSPDELPILGFGPLERLLLAAGHFRKGILLAPATARIVADMIVGAPPPLSLEPFRLERFADAHIPQR